MKTLPILVSIFVIIMIVKLIKQRQDNKLSNFNLLAWLGLWLAVLLVFWQPEITSLIAFNLGIKRGADLVVYLSIIVILYLLYRIFVRFNKLDEALTKLVREDAIKMLKMAARDKVLIIIASFNGQKYWPDLLPLLAQEVYADFDLEIVIVDNNSSDGSQAYITKNYPQFKLFAQNTNLGFVGANNLAYDYAVKQAAKYIYLLNQDTIIKPGFLAPLYEFAKNHPFGSLQSKINLWPDCDHLNTTGNAIHFLGFGYGLDSGQVDNKKLFIKKINYASGAGVFLSMAAINKNGGLFSPNLFMYLEDLDLGWSLNLLGFDNYLVPASQIYHKYEFKRSLKQVYWFERNRLWVYLKNYSLATIIILLPAYLIMELGQLFFAAKNKYLLAKFKSYTWLFSLEEWHRLNIARKKIQSARLRSERQVVSNFSGQILFQPLDSGILRLANVFFNLYWQVVKSIIFW